MQVDDTRCEGCGRMFRTGDIVVFHVKGVTNFGVAVEPVHAECVVSAPGDDELTNALPGF